MGVGITVTLIVVVIIGLIFALIANNQYNDEKMQKLKQEEIRKQKEFQQVIEKMKPDKLIGDQDVWIAFKENNIVIPEKLISLDNCAYYHNQDETILMLPDPYDSVSFGAFNDEQRQEIVDYLDKYNVPQIQTYFRITDGSGLSDKISFNHDYEYAYMVDTNDESFQISGSKNSKLKWKLTNIEFTPHYVTDYEVTTQSEESGRVNGRAGAAILGGLVGGTTGAVIGSSMGREINSTTISHSNNSANAREIPATALLTIESSDGDKVKIAEQYYEDDIIILKKYFLVEQEQEKETVKDDRNIVSKIKELKKMMDNEIITQEEFELGKKKLLNS